MQDSGRRRDARKKVNIKGRNGRASHAKIICVVKRKTWADPILNRMVNGKIICTTICCALLSVNERVVLYIELYNIRKQGRM